MNTHWIKQLADINGCKWHNNQVVSVSLWLGRWTLDRGIQGLNPDRGTNIIPLEKVLTLTQASLGSLPEIRQ